MDQAHAAAQNVAVHQRQQRFGVGMDVLVQRVLFLEEVPAQAIAVQMAVVQHADVAAGAEGLFPGGAQHHGDDVPVVGPVLQLTMEEAHHRQCHGIKAGGAIEGEVADAVAHFDQ